MVGSSLYSHPQSTFLNDIELQSGIVIRSHLVDIDILASDSIYVTETLVVQNTLENTSYNKVGVWINQSLTTILVEDAEGSLNYGWIPNSNNTNFITVSLRRDLSYNDTALIIIKYDLFFDLVTIEDDMSIYYYFEYFSTVTYRTLKMSISITLPPRSFLHDTEGISPYYPTSSSQSVFNNRLTLSWSLIDLEATTNPLFFVRFDKPITTTTISIFWDRGVLLLFIGLIIGIGLGVGGFYAFSIYQRREELTEISETVLNDTQKEILKTLFEKDNKVSQNELVEYTGYSKSKISRNLHPLESQSLIEREKWGRTYIVRLTEDGKKVVKK